MKCLRRLIPGLLLVAMAAAQAGSAQDVLRELESGFAAELQGEGVVGAGFILTDEDETVGRFGYGFSDAANGKRVDANTIYHWASVTKAFTAVAIMQLIERELLTLDASAVDFLPELRAIHNPFGAVEQITVRRLLSHSSGLRSPSWPWKDNGAEWQPHEPHSWSQLVAMMPYTDVRFEPGSRFGYSNLGTIVLGQIVEQISGDDIEVYIDKNVLKPLGMYSAYFDSTPWHLEGVKSHGYFIEDGQIRDIGPDVYTGITAANGGLNASLADMSRFARFVAGTIQHPDVLRADTLRTMSVPGHELSSDDERRVSVGLGLFVTENAIPGRDEREIWIGHSGYQLTHRSSVYANPRTGQTAVVAANTVTRGTGNPSEANLRRRLFTEFFPVAEEGE